MGTENRNQNDIINDAHDGKIVQIVSLSGQKLHNKYFATKCIFGDLSIWSATPHPDKVFTIEYVDQDESNIVLQDTNRDSNAEEVPVAPPKVEEPEPVAEDEEAPAEEEEVDEDGNPIPKKKAPVVVVKKDKSGRISSERDCLIEIKWNQTVI